MSKTSFINVIPDPLYNPETQSYTQTQSPITPRTKIGRGITIAKFLGSSGNKTSFDHIEYESLRREIARNLTLHARAIDLINGNTFRFNDHRVVVSEGVCKRHPIDTGDPTMAAKALGRLCYYQVVDVYGDIDFEKTFDVAMFWIQHLKFQKLSLDYDDYSPDGALTAQIGLLMPEVPSNYQIEKSRFNQEVETVFNNYKIEKYLVEFLQKEEANPP